MDLTRAIQYAIQIGRSWSIYFEWPFPLTGSRAFESGIDYRIFGVIAIIAALWSVMTLPTVNIFGIRGIQIPRCVVAASQPLSSPVQKRVISVMRATIDFDFSWPRWQAS